MFDRITISEVPSSKRAHIAFTVLKPRGWETQRDDDWIAFSPMRHRFAGFIIMMPSAKRIGPERLLESPDGLKRYAERVLPDLELLPETDEEDNTYELAIFRGGISGVPGRVMVVGTALQIEDVNFALVGVTQDERFHLDYPLFKAVALSFQPIVTGSR